MSVTNSTLNIGERSTFTESVLGDSTLNNVHLNKRNLSEITTEEYATQNTAELTISSSKLSITLASNERKILGKKCRTGYSSMTNGTQNTVNGTSENTSDEMKTFSDDKDDASVISIEEEDGDDGMEISTLKTTYIETPEKDMFSHLQPKNVAKMDNKIENVHEVENEDIIPQEGDLSIQQDESDLISEEGDLSIQQNESEIFQNPVAEVGRRLWYSTADKQLYTKGCLWSPDGTCLLVPVNLDGMHVVELPTDLYTLHELSTNRDLSDLTSAVHVKEGGTVYDFCWYPYMNSNDPSTCGWIATRQHEPIHMWDAFSGQLRCSYRGYDDVDEVESAISVIFSSDGQKVLGGYKKSIKIFDTNIPGRDYSSIAVKKAVSCFALTTDNSNCVTAGTWTGYINHYDLRAPKLGPLFTLGGHCGGITLLKYSDNLYQNWYLFSGARKDNKIMKWDMRNYLEPVQIFERNAQTNQRIYYDIKPPHKWIASGDKDGLLRIWSLEDERIQFELPLHGDSCNGVSFHPSMPIISTSSGQYHFVDVSDSDKKSIESVVNYENSLLMLWYGPLEENSN